jgi:hypothetical protein
VDEAHAVEHVAGPRAVGSRRSALSAPTVCAVRPRRSAKRSIRGLNGTVAIRPSTLPSAMSCGTIASNRSDGTCMGMHTAGLPAAANRALNTSGERTCAIGSPMIG